MNQKYKFFPNAATGFLSDEDTKKYFSRLGFAVFGFIVSSSVISIGLCLLYEQLVKTVLPWLGSYEMLILNIISIFSIYCVGLPIFLMISEPLPKIVPFKEKMKVKSWFGGLCIALLLFNVGNYISSMLILSIENVMNITTSNPVGEMVAQNDIWLTVIFAVIIAPILEEIFFRKIICDKLLPLGEGYAIFVSAAIFALIHGNFYQFAYAFLLGAFFSFIYVKTGKLTYSIIYHILINFIGTLVTLWLNNLIDWVAIEKLYSSELSDPATALTQLVQLTWPMLVYEAILTVLYIIGIVAIFKAKKKNEIRLEAGILPPPKQHRFSNIFLSIGVAATIAVSAFNFVLSLTK